MLIKALVSNKIVLKKSNYMQLIAEQAKSVVEKSGSRFRKY